MMYQDWDLELKGEHILINAFAEGDGEAYSRLLLGPLYDALTQISPEEKIPSGFKKIISRTEENATHAIRLLPDHKMIGWITLQKDRDGEPDIGISLVEDLQNKGYGPGAIQLYGNYLHEKYGLQQLKARTSSKNLQCRNALTKTGAILEKEIPDERLAMLMEKNPDHQLRPGFQMITCCYRIPLPIRKILPSPSSAQNAETRKKAQAEYEEQEAQLTREIQLVELEYLQKNISVAGKVPDVIMDRIAELKKY